LEAVLAVFLDTYNKYGEVKPKHQIPVKPNAVTHLSACTSLKKFRSIYWISPNHRHVGHAHFSQKR
jgi:hypothetical protein